MNLMFTGCDGVHNRICSIIPQYFLVEMLTDERTVVSVDGETASESKRSGDVGNIY